MAWRKGTWRGCSAAGSVSVRREVRGGNAWVSKDVVMPEMQGSGV